MFGQYNDLVWLMLGAFAYRTLTAMLSYGHLVNMMTEVNKQCLTLLGLVSADLSLAREVKYSTEVDPETKVLPNFLEYSPNEVIVVGCSIGPVTVGPMKAAPTS